MSLDIQKLLVFIENLIEILRWQDIVDIIVVIFICYKILMYVRESSAAQVIKAIVVIIIATQFFGLLQLNVTYYFFSTALQIGILAIIILFQPELRRMLDTVGRHNFLRGFFSRTGREEESTALRSISLLVATADRLSKTKTGALICIERDTKLGDIIKTGTSVDAEISDELLCNIFYDKAPLHDGAVIIKNWRIGAAACRLPLSENKNISRDLGMRHRAGLGLSETTDSFVLIVSEETGGITVALGGILKTNLTPSILTALMKKELISSSDEELSIKKLISKKEIK